MRPKFIGVLAVVAMVLAIAAPVAAQAPNACPDAAAGDFNDPSTSAGETGEFTIDGQTVTYTVSADGKTITFSRAVSFCVKGGSDENSGVVSGTTFTVNFLNEGGNNPAISNFTVYGLVLTPVTAAAASITPPSCTAAGTLVIPADTASVMYSVSPAYTAGATGTFTVTATAKAGFVLTGTTQWVLTVAPQLTGAACATAATAAAASITPPSCTAAGTLVIPADTASVMYSVSPAYTAGATGTFTVTATAKAGFVLTGTTQWVLTVAPQLTGAACVTGGGTLPGSSAPTTSPSAAAAPARGGTLAGSSVPNTAMDGGPADAPVVLLALLALGGLGVVAQRNYAAVKARR